jgi:two-component system, OmpR family, sensor kinase
MTRMPVRLRVAVAFAIAMALVLAGTGIFIYARLSDDLATSLDQTLRQRAQDVSALVSDPHRSLAAEDPGRLIERGESFAELVEPSGRVLDSTASLHDQPLIGAGALALATRGGRDRFINIPSAPGLNESARLLATPIRRGGRALLVVVGATRENRAEALRNLRTELLIAGPVALLLATGLGYVLAGAGLRTVEAMRARAASISADRPGERLPVPPTGDELERLGETLNHMLDRLEAALEQERAFVAEAGHELRTPLALLRAELDYALHYAEDEDELRDALRTASDETDRLVQLAADLLLIASAEQGRIPMRPEPLDAEELMGSVKKRFAWRAEAQGRRIELDARAGLTITGDRLRLEQALGNLVDNALRHGTGTVTLLARSADGRIELGVHDEGPGFEPDFAGRAFQRFSRGDSAHAGPGAGLGLAIVETIAHAHGGSAAACGGAQVVISLPGSEASALSRTRDPRTAR